MHGVMISKAGRKRKSGNRYPSGDLIPQRVNVAAIAKFHPERQSLPEADRANEKAGTRLGRMLLRQQITDEQLEGARRYAGDVRRYQVVIGCPSPNAPSLDLHKTSGGHIAFDAAEIRNRTDNYNAAYRAVYDAGHRAARAVARVAVYDEWIPAGTTVEDLLRGLSALVEHYGLTTRRKSVNLGNR